MKRSLTLLISVIALFFFAPRPAYATHLMGGDLNYKHLKGNQYELKFAIYRDCFNGIPPMPSKITYRVYSAANQNKFSNHTVNRTSIKKLTLNVPKCANPKNVCVQRGIYTDTITIGSDTAGYYVSWASNERNHALISNLKYCKSSCSSTQCQFFTSCRHPYGMVWSAYIPADTIKNSSPYFLTNPVPFLCNNRLNIFNHLGFDPDGDSLVFSLVKPWSPSQGPTTSTPFPPFKNVVYKSGYSATAPLGSGNKFKINPNTGEITAKPSKKGNYVIAISIKEYRHNPVTKKTQFIGEIRRDLQFIVGGCGGKGFAPQFQKDTIGTTRRIFPGDTLCFTIEARDLDTLRLTASGAILNPQSNIAKPLATFPGDTGHKVAKAQFCWTPNCQHITYTSPHLVKFKVVDDSCNIVQKTYSIYVKSPNIILPPKLKCVNVLSNNAIRLTWDTATGSQDFSNYSIYRKGPSGVFTQVDSLLRFDSTTWIDSSVTGALTGKYSYYIRGQNRCGLEGLPSDTLNSVILDTTYFSPHLVKLSWNEQHKGSNPYYYLQVQQGNSFTTVDSTQKRYHFINDCDSTATFRIMVKDTFSCASRSNALQLSLQDTTGPIAPEIIRTTLNQSGSEEVVFRKSFANDIAKYFILRSANQGTYQLIDSLSNSGQDTFQYQDQNITPGNQYCYRVVAKDSCGNYGDTSQPHCPPKLTGTQGNLKVYLSWQQYQGFSLDSQVVEKFKNGSWTRLAGLNSTDTTFIDSQGLRCNIPYTYRLVSYGSPDNIHYNYSNQVNITPFDTVKPQVPLLLKSTVISQNSIQVLFDTVPDQDVNRYEIFYGTGGNFSSAGTVQQGNTSPVTFNINGLNTGKNTYCVYVRALDSCNNNASLPSDTHCVIRLEGSPGNLNSQLTWSPYTGDTVQKYIIQIDTGSGYVNIDSTSPSDTTYIDPGLLCNVPYSYRILARTGNTQILSTFSNKKTIVPFDTIAPSAPVLHKATVLNKDSIQIMFDTVSDQDVDRYEIYYSSNGQSFTSAGTIAQGNASPITFTINGLNTVKNTYCFYVRAIDSCNNNLSLPGDTHCTIHLSGSPGNLSSILSWQLYEGFKIAKYYIQNLQTTGWSVLDSLSGNDSTFTDTNLSCNRSFTYRVKGVGQDTTYSNPVTVTPFDTVPPSRVNMVKVTVTGSNSIQVVFNQVSGPQVNRYVIYSAKNKGSFGVLDTVYRPAGNPVFYLHSGINPVQNRYCYQIKALDSCGDNLSRTSETHCAIHLQGSPGNLSNELHWSPYQGFTLKNYLVKRIDSGSWKTVKTLNPNDTAFTDTGLSCNLTRYYKIVALEQSGAGAQSISDSITLTPFDTIDPATPRMQEVSVITNKKIRLTWKASTSQDVDRYLIYRGINNGNLNVYDTIGKTTVFTDTGLNPVKNTYCYAVAALDSCNDNQSPVSQKHCSISLALTTQGCRQEIQLNWSSYSYWDSGVNKYDIYREIQGQSEKLLTSLTGGTTTYTDQNLDYHNNYCYRVKAYQNNDTGQVFSPQICGNTFQPSTPVLKSASKQNTSTSSGKILVKWKSISGQPKMDYFKLYYRKDSSSTFTTLASNLPLAQDSFLHQGLNTKEADHLYYLTALDTCGNESDSQSIHKTMNLKISVGQLVHNLNWTPYKGWIVKDYLIQRKKGNRFKTLDTVPGSDSSFIMKPAPCNVNIFYRVIARSFKGYRSLSDTSGDQAIDSIPADRVTMSNATVVKDSIIRLDFTGADSMDIYAYDIQRKTGNGNFKSTGQIIFNQPGDTLIFYDSTPTRNNYYCFRVVTLDSCLNATPSDTYCVSQLKGNPANLANRLEWHPFKGYILDAYTLLHYEKGSWKKLTSLNASDTSFLHDSLSCNVPHIYKIKGTEMGGNKVTYSDSIILTPFDTIRPSPPNVRFVTVPISGEIQLKFDTVPEQDVDRYEIFSSTGSATFTKTDTLPQGSISPVTYSQKGLQTGPKLYCFYVKAVDSCASNASLPSDTHCTIQLNAIKGNLRNTLTWSHYSGFPVKKYYIQRWDGVSWQILDSADPNTNSYTDSSGIACNVRYRYRIKALSTQPQQFASISDTAHAIPFDTIAPGPPKIKYVTVLDSSTLKLAWKPGSPDVKLFELWFRSAQGKWNIFDTVKQATQTTLNGLNTLDSQYCTKLIAIDSCSANRSAFGNPHCAIQLSGQPGNLENHLAWTPYQGFEKIKAYRILSYQKGSWKPIDTVSEDTTGFTHSPLICKKPYVYKIEAIDSVSNVRSHSDSIQLTPYDTVKPAPPLLRKVSVLPDQKIEITFEPSSSPDADHYLIYVSKNGDPFKLLDTVMHQKKTLLNYVHRGIRADSHYFCYYIHTVDSCFQNRSVPTRTHCAVQLEGNAGNMKNRLTWLPYIGFKNPTHIIQRKSSGTWHKLGSRNDTGFIDTFGLACNIPYTYRIMTLHPTLKDTSYSDTVVLQPFDTISPDPPKLKYASVLSGNTLKIAWHKNSAPDVKIHEIWQATGSGTFSKAGQIRYDTSFVVKNATPGKNTYRYYVVALDSCPYPASGLPNRSIPSDTDRTYWATLSSGACVPLIRVSRSPYRTFEMGIKEYEVYRSTDGNFRKFTTLPPNQDFWVDSSVNRDQTYCYKFSAVENSTGYSSFTDSFCLQPWIFPKPDTSRILAASVMKTGKSFGKVKLTWNRASRADTLIKGYRLYHKEPGTGNYTLIEEELNLNDTTYIHDSLNTANKNHRYLLNTFNICDTGKDATGPSSRIHQTMNLDASNNNLQIDLKWTSYRGFNVKEYIIFRSVNKGNYRKLAYKDPADTTFADSNVRCLNRYSYKIGARKAGTSKILSFSDTLSFKAYDTIPPDIPAVNYATVTKTGSPGIIMLYLQGVNTANREGYILLQGSGAGLFPVDTIYDKNTGSITHVDSTPYTELQAYTYALKAIDSCGNIAGISEKHTTIYLDAKAINDSIKISWSPYRGWKDLNYTLEKKELNGNWKAIATPGENQRQFTDPWVKCHQRYLYRIVATEKNTSYQSISNTDTVTAIETTPPITVNIKRVTVTRTDPSNGAILIEWDSSTSTDAAYYNLYRSNDQNNYSLVKDSITSTSIQDSDLPTAGNRFFYKIETVDSCGNKSTQRSPEHGTILLSSNPGNEGIWLNWSGYTGWKTRQFLLERNGKIIDTLNNSQFSYFDSGLICTRNYTYRILAFSLDSPRVQSASNISTSQPFDNISPAAPFLKSASVSNPNDRIRLEWEAPQNADIKNYQVWRKVTGENKYSLIHSTNSSAPAVYTDTFKTGQSRVCYYIRANDHCDNTGEPGNSGCIIILEGEAGDLQNKISWDPYLKWPEGVSYYRVFKLSDSTNWKFLKKVSKKTRSFVDKDLSLQNKEFCYQVEAVLDTNRYTLHSRSTVVCLKQAPHIFIPNSISPRRTYGLNDEFAPEGAFIRTYEMRIYNRWGQKIYETENSEPWDGRYKSEIVPAGTYIYQLLIHGYDQKTREFTGTVNIVD